jgi:hypothetical protein
MVMCKVEIGRGVSFARSRIPRQNLQVFAAQ